MVVKRKNLPYRPCVGIMLINKDGLVLVARRKGSKDSWQMPQGGIDKGEKPKQAALRELEEEIGTAKGKVIGKTKGWLKYDLPKKMKGRVWKGKYRGQKQKWFAVKFVGKNKHIDLEASGHAEFDAWKWVTVDELIERIVPFKRAVYKEVVAQLGYLVKPQ